MKIVKIHVDMNLFVYVHVHVYTFSCRTGTHSSCVSANVQTLIFIPFEQSTPNLNSYMYMYIQHVCVCTCTCMRLNCRFPLIFIRATLYMCIRATTWILSTINSISLCPSPLNEKIPKGTSSVYVLGSLMTVCRLSSTCTCRKHVYAIMHNYYMCTISADLCELLVVILQTTTASWGLKSNNNIIEWLIYKCISTLSRIFFFLFWIFDFYVYLIINQSDYWLCIIALHEVASILLPSKYKYYYHYGKAKCTFHVYVTCA